MKPSFQRACSPLEWSNLKGNLEREGDDFRYISVRNSAGGCREGGRTTIPRRHDLDRTTWMMPLYAASFAHELASLFPCPATSLSVSKNIGVKLPWAERLPRIPQGAHYLGDKRHPVFWSILVRVQRSKAGEASPGCS